MNSCEQDYVCSQCCVGKHDGCLTSGDARCDCIACLVKERDRYRAALERIVRDHDEMGGDICDDCCRSLIDDPPVHDASCFMFAVRAALEGK